jgi:hypothetical protein
MAIGCADRDQQGVTMIGRRSTGANHVEGEASRANDDGRTEFDGLHATGAQGLANFLPALGWGELLPDPNPPNR